MLPTICAWAGCRETCVGDGLPEGWIWLATFRTTAVPGVLDFGRDRVQRDGVLCREHAPALERMLKPL